MCHNSSVIVRGKTFRPNENRTLCGVVEAPAILHIFFHVNAHSTSHLSIHANVCIVAASVLLYYDLEKCNISATRPILASSPLPFKDLREYAVEGLASNGGIGKLPMSRINPCLSVFRRSRPSVIKYLLTFVSASCFICQTVERHGKCSLRHFKGLPR